MTIKKKKICIFIEHNIHIRHFIKSDAFGPLMDAHDVLFYFPEPNYKNNARVSVDLNTLGLQDRVRHLTVSHERMKLWAKLNHVNQLRWRPLTEGSDIRRQVTIAAIGPGHVREYSFLSWPLVYQWFRWRTMVRAAKIPHADLEKLLDDEKPDVLIHPTALWGPYIYDLIEASERRQIPLVAITNSWDNPLKNIGMPLRPTKLLVWGKQTFQFATGLGGTPVDRVIKFGAAQFEVYSKPPRITREQFFREHEIAPDKTLLLYAGSTRPVDEYAHLQVLDEAIESGLLGNAAVVYRPHPFGGGVGTDVGKLLDHSWRHVRIETSMQGYLERIREEGNIGIFPDYGITRDVLASVDAVISPLSTILIESVIMGKPSMAFLPVEEDQAIRFHRAASLIHFKDIFKMEEFLCAEGRKELVEKAVTLIERTRDPAFLKRLPEVAAFFVEPFDIQFGERLKTFVEGAENWN